MIIVFDNLKKCINTDAILGFEVTQEHKMRMEIIVHQLDY